MPTCLLQSILPVTGSNYSGEYFLTLQLHTGVQLTEAYADAGGLRSCARHTIVAVMNVISGAGVSKAVGT